MKQWTSGPVGRLAALYVSLCLRFWSEFLRRIPPWEPPICFRSKRKKEKGTPERRERAQQGAPPRHATPPHHGVALPFLSVHLPVPVQSGNFAFCSRPREKKKSPRKKKSKKNFALRAKNKKKHQKSTKTPPKNNKHTPKNTKKNTKKNFRADARKNKPQRPQKKPIPMAPPGPSNRKIPALSLSLSCVGACFTASQCGFLLGNSSSSSSSSSSSCPHVMVGFTPMGVNI